MFLLRNRLFRGYAALLTGMLLLVVRRLVAPSQIDAAPLPIAVRTFVWQCYTEPNALACSELALGGLTLLLLVVALGWGSPLSVLVTIALIIPPAGFYFLLSPSWAALMVFLLPLLAYAILDRWLPQVLTLEQGTPTAEENA